jgi:hypothetical protein
MLWIMKCKRISNVYIVKHLYVLVFLLILIYFFLLEIDRVITMSETRLCCCCWRKKSIFFWTASNLFQIHKMSSSIKMTWCTLHFNQWGHPFTCVRTSTLRSKSYLPHRSKQAERQHTKYVFDKFSTSIDHMEMLTSITVYMLYWS